MVQIDYSANLRNNKVKIDIMFNGNNPTRNWPKNTKRYLAKLEDVFLDDYPAFSCKQNDPKHGPTFGTHYGLAKFLRHEIEMIKLQQSEIKHIKLPVKQNVCNISTKDAVFYEGPIFAPQIW